MVNFGHRLTNKFNSGFSINSLIIQFNLFKLFLTLRGLLLLGLLFVFQNSIHLFSTTTVILIYSLIFCYLTGLLIISWATPREHPAADQYFIQVLADIFLITAMLNLMNKDLTQDTFFLFLLPLLFAGRYLKSAQFNQVILLTVGVISWVGWAEGGITYLWGELGSRYLVLGGVWFARHYYYVRLKIRYELAEQGRFRNAKRLIALPGTDKLIEFNNVDEEFVHLIQEFNTRLNNIKNRVVGLSQVEYQEALYEMAVKFATEKLGCETAAAFSIRRGIAYREVATNIADDFLPQELYRPGQGLTGEVMVREEDGTLSGRLRYFNLFKKKAEPSPMVEKYYLAYKAVLPSGDIKHFLAQPIYGSGVLIGILRVLNKHNSPIGFDDHDAGLLYIIATLLGSALDNSCKLNRLQTLADICTRLENSNSRSGIYRTIREAGVNLLEVEDCSIFIIEDNKEYLRLVESHTIPATNFRTQWRLFISDKPKSGLLAYVAATKQPLFFKGQDYRQHPAYRGYNEHYKYLPSEECYSMLLLPILTPTQECLGVIRFINKTQPDNTAYNLFNSEDYELARNLISQFVSALKRVNEVETKAREREQLVRLQRELIYLGKHALKHFNDPQQGVLEILVNKARHLLESDLVCLLPFLQNYQGVYGFRAEWAKISQQEKIPTTLVAPPRPNGMTEQIMTKEEGYMLIDLEKQPQFMSDFLREQQIRTVLGVALVVDDYQLGVLYFDYRRAFTPTPEQLELAKLVAILAALLLYNLETVKLKSNLGVSKNSSLEELQLVDALSQHQESMKQVENCLQSIYSELDSADSYATRFISEFLRYPERLDPERQLERIKQSGEWIRHQMVALERALKNGGLDVQPIQAHFIDLTNLVHEAVAEHIEEAEERGVHLVCTSGNELPLVLADEAYILSILSNLITNALDYTSASGQIKVRYYQEAGWIMVEVKDSGKGINPEEMETIFHKYKRGENHSGGLGCGLWYAREFAHLHKGEIQVQSWPGQGSCFTLKLPLPVEPAPDLDDKAIRGYLTAGLAFGLFG